MNPELLCVAKPPAQGLDMPRPIWRRCWLAPHYGFAPGRGGYAKAVLRTRSPSFDEDGP